MSQLSSPSTAIVVGVDGSRTAVDAALWAADEAVSRDIPLRLLYAIAPTDGARYLARELATAEMATRSAFTAVEATEKPVKIEVEIVQERPVQALLDASRSAAMIVVGAVGLKHAMRGRIGSTAAAVAASAHCPTAVVRRHAVPASANSGVILAEVDDWPTSGGVLQCAIDEALLRSAPLRVVTTWQSHLTDKHDPGAVAYGNRLVHAQLDRRLAQWRRRHPQLDVAAVANHGSLLDYLAHHAESIQLVVVGAERSGGADELIGTRGLTVLHDTECSVITCGQQRRL